MKWYFIFSYDDNCWRFYRVFISLIVSRLSFMVRVCVLVILDIVVVMNIFALLQERSLRVLPVIRIADLVAGLDFWPAP